MQPQVESSLSSLWGAASAMAYEGQLDESTDAHSMMIAPNDTGAAADRGSDIKLCFMLAPLNGCGAREFLGHTRDHDVPTVQLAFAK